MPLITCLSKFDGHTTQEMMNGDQRRYKLTRLPKYLIVHIKRFSKNTQQEIEKNPTIVNFPVRSTLEMGYLSASEIVRCASECVARSRWAISECI